MKSVVANIGLEKVDLRKAKINNLDFSGLNLSNFDFSDCTL